MQTLNCLTRIFALLVVLSSLGLAQAQTPATFTGVAPTGYTNTPVTSQSLTFTTTGILRVGDAASLVESALPGDGNYLVYNSTVGYGISFATTANTPFNLVSLDLGGWYNFGSQPRNVTVTGERADLSTISNQLSVQPGSFSHFALSGFSNLMVVNLSHAGGNTSYYVGVDNVVTTPVPEPQTYALMLAGLMLLGTSVRRRMMAQRAL